MTPTVQMCQKRSKFFLFFLYPIIFLGHLTRGCVRNFEEDPRVCLKSGPCFLGRWDTTDQGNRYATFQSIPYAQPPVGELRFKNPLPMQFVKGSMDVSSKEKVICTQRDMLTNVLKGTEDCLVLSIHVPQSAFKLFRAGQFPVMVWIHGGAFVFGSGQDEEYGPEYFMDTQDVILVTVNYRLGPLGFLSLGNEMVPGNAGLRDQNLALQWVQSNIAQFGGRPDKVTIFGESAGSYSCGMHILSPMSRGLFKRAILQSKSPLGPSWMAISPKDALNHGESFKERLQCDKVQDPLKCLQTQSIENVLGKATLDENFITWMPVPDAEFTIDPFLTQDPKSLLENGEFPGDIEVIIGSTKDEGILSVMEQILVPSKWKTLQDNFNPKLVKNMLNIADNENATSDEIERALKVVEFYVGSIDNINQENLQSVTDMYTDATFLHGNYKTAEYFMKKGVKTYQYILTYVGEHSFSELFGIPVMGVGHADDLQYLFNQKVKLNVKDTEVKDLMIEAWTNFASNGDPNGMKIGAKNVWETIDEGRKYWNISGTQPTMEFSDEIRERMTFWDSIMNYA